MKKEHILTFLIFLACAAFVVNGTVYRVGENDLVVVTHFGRIHKTRTGQGIYFKLPYQKTHYFKKDTYETEITSQVHTLCKKRVDLKIQASWKIVDPPLFLMQVNSLQNASGRVKDLLTPAAKEVFNSYKVDNSISVSNMDSSGLQKGNQIVEHLIIRIVRPALKDSGIDLIGLKTVIESIN